MRNIFTLRLRLKQLSVVRVEGSQRTRALQGVQTSATLGMLHHKHLQSSSRRTLLQLNINGPQEALSCSTQSTPIKHSIMHSQHTLSPLTALTALYDPHMLRDWLCSRRDGAAAALRFIGKVSPRRIKYDIISTLFRREEKDERETLPLPFPPLGVSLQVCVRPPFHLRQPETSNRI